ncbi:hypothetical protein GCM10007884_51390 [Methylobacterium brachythecii]|uniref:Uncharacterized protein n=1 Tax=Methylobacterium brachythecii TaxID=1176177 RepID=A0ABQ6DAS9_9HYPH|nr:hypothetical protein GCM10007884_51390 [Methylobacterium brachythecii]
MRSVVHHIRNSCALSPVANLPTIIYEDNVACIAQIKGGYIKGDRTKHIPPKYFMYTHELEKSHEIEIQQVKSSENVADLFTKSLPTKIFQKMVYNIGMRQTTRCERIRGSIVHES